MPYEQTHEAGARSIADAASAGNPPSTGTTARFREVKLPPPAVGSPATVDDDLNAIYWKYFLVQDAVSPALRRAVHALRYQVYCVEHPYENPTASPQGLEEDGFDAHSAHALLVHRPTGVPCGTVRLVLPLAERPEASFAMQQLCDDPLLGDPERFPVLRMAEVSRLCVPKTFRQRVQDRWYQRVPANLESLDQEWRRVIPNMTLGLFEWIIRYSVANGLTHWCAVMEPRLLRLLARLGIHFETVGGLVEYHGLRQPCVLKMETMLERMLCERPDVWAVLTRSFRADPHTAPADDPGLSERFTLSAPDAGNGWLTR